MKTVKYIIICSLAFFALSCKKGYLDIKPDQSLLVPTSLADLQTLIDNPVVMNFGPGLHIISSDEFIIYTTGNLANLSTPERNSYLWSSDIYEGGRTNDWNSPYQQVFYANVVLDGLKKVDITQENQVEWNRTKGSALFFRALAFYQLCGQFASHYKASTAPNLPGIPLKLNSDVNERPGRGSLQQAYSRILSDLTEAYPLLPPIQEKLLTRPSKLAVNALLARIYLVMGDYEKAHQSASECLAIKKGLLDYNTLLTTSIRPISFSAAESTEVIFWQWMISYSFGTSTVVSIAPDVISSYDQNDLRKNIFFRNRGNGIYTFKGNYTGDSYLFTGLAVDEIYLIRAECRARLNDVQGAMSDLNTLMVKRWDSKGSFPTFSATNADDALRIILFERNKELVTRGLRWSDLRRLNDDTKFAVTLKRSLDNVAYFLSPNDKKYIFPIPQDELDGSGIAQNLR